MFEMNLLNLTAMAQSIKGITEVSIITDFLEAQAGYRNLSFDYRQVLFFSKPDCFQTFITLTNLQIYLEALLSNFCH